MKGHRCKGEKKRLVSLKRNKIQVEREGVGGVVQRNVYKTMAGIRTELIFEFKTKMEFWPFPICLLDI